MGLVKKPTGFMTSSQFLLNQLDKKCLTTTCHSWQAGSSCPSVPRHALRGNMPRVVQQKKHDQSGQVTTGKLSYVGLKNLVRHMCDLQGSGSNAIEQKLLTRLVEGTWRPTGDYPDHWDDYWHEEGGGDDSRGVRPQMGFTILQNEIDGLSFNGG